MNNMIKRDPIVSIHERLKLSPHGKNKWVLLESFTYYRGIKGSEDYIIVPKDFVFDGASTNKLLRRIPFVGTPMDTDTIVAALIHDWLYKDQKHTRSYCDDMFNEIMEVTGVSNPKRIIYYVGVRIGGWVAYNNHKKNLKK